MSKCTHEELIRVDIAGHYDSWGDWVEADYKWEVKSTCVDMDLHRYCCTKCDEVMYYSQSARNFYEEGIKSPYIDGLK